MENLEKKLEIFLQKLKKLNTKSLPGARNWYTHWSDDPPQSEGSNFRIFDYLVFFAHLRGQKILKSGFIIPKTDKKEQKIKIIKNLILVIVEGHQANVCFNS